MWKRLFEQSGKMTSDLAKWTIEDRMFLAGRTAGTKALWQWIPGMLEATVRTSALL